MLRFCHRDKGNGPGGLFGIGLFDAGFLGALCISLSTSWAVGEIFGWSHSLNYKVKDAPWYAVYLIMLLTSGAVVLIPGAPLVTITMFVQVVAVTLLPAALVFLILLLNDPSLMGEFVNTRRQKHHQLGNSDPRGLHVNALGCANPLPQHFPGRCAMSMSNGYTAQARVSSKGNGSHHVIYFSELLKRRVCAGKIKDRLGKLTDLVFALSEPYPHSVGVYIEHGWGKPTEFIPWDRVTRIEEDAIFVQPPDHSGKYPPFVDQPGWMLLDEHLMGRTILDTDGRKVEVVNDICLLESGGKLLLVDVDISFNGFLRRIGLGKIRWIKDQLISWKYVQPLSVEDALSTDQVSLSLTRKEILDLPGEDLADVLEELSGLQQQAFFASLDAEKAAETLMETEPRAQRQIVEDLTEDKARSIFAELTVSQLADLFAVMPHDQETELMELLSEEQAERVKAILSEREATARNILSTDFMTVSEDAKVGDVLKNLKLCEHDPGSLSYLYVTDDTNILLGVVDLRHLVLAVDDATVGDLMISPVVAAEDHSVRKDLAEMFCKYFFRMVPVVDHEDHLLGIIRYNDIMKGVEIRVKD